MTIPKRVSDRLVKSIGRIQSILQNAKDRDVNEADTVSIIKDMLAEIFGYDKYLDITMEFQIRGTYCDLAIKFNNKVDYLIEVKAIGLDLKENHLRQATDYGANLGIQWIILTNGICWQVYKIKYEQPISAALICSFDFENMDPDSEEEQDKLYILCKEGLLKDAREDYHEKVLVVNRFLMGALILSDEIISALRRELRKLSDGVLVSPEEITKVLTTEVIKRDVLEGEDADKAQARVKKYYAKATRKPRETRVEAPDTMVEAEVSKQPVSTEIKEE